MRVAPSPPPSNGQGAVDGKKVVLHVFLKACVSPSKRAVGGAPTLTLDVGGYAVVARAGTADSPPITNASVRPAHMPRMHACMHASVECSAPPAIPFWTATPLRVCTLCN